jgi:hypothetical protein
MEWRVCWLGGKSGTALECGTLPPSAAAEGRVLRHGVRRWPLPFTRGWPNDLFEDDRPRAWRPAPAIGSPGQKRVNPGTWHYLWSGWYSG